MEVWVLEAHQAAIGYAVWKPTGNAEIIDTADILDTVAYSVLPNGCVGTILPADYR